MTATVYQLAVPGTDAAPDLTTWVAAGMNLSGYDSRDAALVAPPCSAAALAAAMEELAWAEPETVARLWDARP